MNIKELSHDYFSKTNGFIKLLFFENQRDIGNLFGFSFSLGIGCNVNQNDIDFLKEINETLINTNWVRQPINIRRWVEINELIILHFYEHDFQYKFIKKNSLNTATILAYHLLEDITKQSGYWNDDGKLIKSIPQNIADDLFDDDGVKRTYKINKQISSLEHKLILYIKSSPDIVQNLFEGLENGMNAEGEVTKIQGVSYDHESIYKKLARNRNIVSHGNDANLWESILLSLIFGMIHFYYNFLEG